MYTFLPIEKILISIEGIFINLIISNCALWAVFLSEITVQTEGTSMAKWYTKLLKCSFSQQKQYLKLMLVLIIYFDNKFYFLLHKRLFMIMIMICVSGGSSFVCCYANMAVYILVSLEQFIFILCCVLYVI